MRPALLSATCSSGLLSPLRGPGGRAQQRQPFQDARLGGEGRRWRPAAGWRPSGGRGVARSATSSPGDFFNSEVVQDEFGRLQSEMQSLAPMISKFADFDLEGKRLFLEQMERFVERFNIFLTRLRLTEDPLAKEMVRQLNVQLLEANISMDAMYQGFKQHAANMRALLAEEERIADPDQLRSLRRAYADMFGTQGGGGAPFARLNSMDPSNLTMEDMVGINDPKCLAAFQDVAGDPSAVEKYRDRPALYQLLKKMLGPGP